MKKGRLSILPIVLSFLMFNSSAAEPPAAKDKGEADKKQDKSITALQDRIKKLENKEKYKKNKMLRPVKDIDFLYEAVIGTEKFDLVPKAGSSCVTKSGKKIISLKDSPWIWGDIQGFASGEQGPVTIDSKVSMNCKLEAVESALGIRVDTDASDLKARITKSYEELNYDDWQSDRIRFAVSASRVSDINAINTAISLHAFPSYRRHMNGRLDLIRRTSFFFSLGNLSSLQNTAESDGVTYSLGLGIEITHGETLTYGRTLYQYRQNTNVAFSQDISDAIGISLTSDLWDALIN